MTYIYQATTTATNIANKVNKPVTTILMCAEYGSGTAYTNGRDVYLPSSNALRNMIYQTLMADATSYGLIGFRSGKLMEGVHATMHPSSVGLREFAEKEMSIMYDYFVEDAYTTFNSNIKGSDNARYVSFLKGGKIYMVVLNMKEYVETTVSIPLTSNNNVTITGYTASAYAGFGTYETTETIDDIVSDGSTLDVTLAPGAAAVYIITPNSTITDNMLK